MEIVAVFPSWTDELARYARERFPLTLFLPLALFLSIAALAGVHTVAPTSVVFMLFTALTLLFQFRLWDDLADRERDGLEHPDRLLPHATSLRHFQALLTMTFAFNLFLLSRQWRQLLLFLLMNGLFFTWYQWLRPTTPSATAHYHLLLAKYPAFVYLFHGGDGASVPLLLAMALVYLCFCVYEPLHDSRCSVPRWLLALEMLLLTLVSALMGLALFPHGGAAALQGVLTALGVLALALLFRRRRTQPDAGQWSYAVFVIGFVEMAIFSMGSVR